MISEPDAWLAIVNAMLGAAMEGDIEQLRAEFKRNSTFRRKIDVLAREIDHLYRLVLVDVQLLRLYVCLRGLAAAISLSLMSAGWISDNCRVSTRLPSVTSRALP